MGKHKRESMAACMNGEASDENYISDLAGELANIAASRGHPELAALLEMAKLEADGILDKQRSLPPTRVRHKQ
jgi:hypothetical protein